MTGWLPFPPRYCEAIPVAITNAGCELCELHYQQLTSWSIDHSDGETLMPRDQFLYDMQWASLM